MPVRLERDRARRLMLRATHLERPAFSAGAAGAREALLALGCIQLDPIDRFGTNPDLVLHARVDGLQRGEWPRATLPGHAFEHFAKERCLLPASLFPLYRDQAVETPWWRLSQRLERVDAPLLDAVLAEVCARGPLSAAELSDHGRVQPLDWSGWKGTGKAGSMALEVLWTRCQVVSAGRTAAGHRIYDLPRRALPQVHDASGGDFHAEALLHRVQAAGLLSRKAGPWWSMLGEHRKGPLLDRLIAEKQLVEVQIAGSTGRWLTLPTLLEAAAPPLDPDDRVRVLGPLDPLMWDRALVQHIFDFEYLWEVYKPAAARRWGYYVSPLLHEGRLVGRVEAIRRKGDPNGGLDLLKTWGEARGPAFDAAMDRLGRFQAN